MGVWSKGLILFKEDEVEFDRKNNGVMYFNVKDYNVKVRKWNIIDCGCHYGVTHGTNGGHCKHIVAVILKLVQMETGFTCHHSKEG